MPGSNVLLIQRLRSVNGKPVAIHTSYLDDRLFGKLRNFDLEHESLLESMEKIYGVHMATSRDSVQAVIAGPEECQLFGAAEGLAVMEVEGISYDMRGKPTRFARAIYRGDVFVLSVVNTHSQATSLALTEPASS
jgi:GntR family transcriptional regulator